MRRFLLGLALGALLFSGAAVMGFGWLLRVGIETAGYAALGVPVSVGLVTLSPLTGRGTVRSLVVANPKGYDGPYAFRADSISVSVRPRTLLAGDVVVERVVVRNPTVRLEGGNLSALKAKASSGGGGDSRAVRIKELEVTGGSVVVAGGLSVPLPDIRLKDVSGRSALSQLLGRFSSGGVGSSAVNALSGLLKKLP